MKKRPWLKSLSSLLGVGGLVLLSTRCFPTPPEPEGECRRVPSDVLDCSAPGYTSDLVDAGLVGYACTGSARPDSDGTYIEGVPQGKLCANKGPIGGGAALGEGGGGNSDEATGYCCTSEPVDCVYDPRSDCEKHTDGYQCWSTNRPESLNPALACSNGNREGANAEYVNYCCTQLPRQDGCLLTETAGCSERMLGFICQGDRLPRGEDLGPNKSRADYFHPTCSTPRPAANPEYNNYCCYMPAPVPIGGTCVNHTSVPGCAPGRFGFACYGPDTPEDDYLPMHCDAGFKGTSAEGYIATLYCCDFQ